MIAQKAPQLVLTDLVHQLEPPIEGQVGHVQPDLDNTVKSLFYWAMDLVIPIGPRMVLLTILRHIDWTEGDGCRASIPTLARESQFSSKTLKGHLKYLLDQKIIMRQRRMNKASETRLAKRLHQPVGEAATPTSGRSGYTSNQSSSSNPFSNQSLVALDPKMDDLLETEQVEVKPEEPEPVQERTMVDEVNDGGTNKFSNLEEEGATEPEPELQPLDKVNDGGRETKGFMVLEEEETRVTTRAKVGAQVAQEWIDLNLPESLMDSQCEWMLNHTWEVWKFHEVTQPYGWKFGKAAALKTVTKDMAARKKFRVDLVQHLMKAGLPSTATPSTWCLGCSKETTTGHGNAFLEGGRRTVDTCEDCAQAPVPIVEIVRTGHRGLIACEGCGKKIKREPDKTHCYSCSKKLVDGQALARTL